MHIADSDKQSIIEWARQHSEIREVWLYGSRSRGDCRADSDIDLAIVTSGADLGERFATWMFADWRDGLKLSHRVQLEWFDPEANLDKVGAGVRKNGLLIYK